MRQILLFCSEVTFDLLLEHTGCDQISDFREGVEFSFRNTREGEWIPLMFFASNTNFPEDRYIKLPNEESIMENSITSDDGNFTLRGYSVPYVIQSNNDTMHNVSVCMRNTQDAIDLQFRWLHTTRQDNKSTIRDVVILDNISVTAHDSTHDFTLLEDDFDDENQTSIE